MRHLRGSLGPISLLLLTLTAVLPAPTAAQRYYAQVNLVSDLPGLAVRTDPRLVNPWGIALTATSPFWISDAGTGFSTLYDGNGVPQPPASPLTVTVPAHPGSTEAGSPTGIVANATTGFVVRQGTRSGRSNFIFATEDGTLTGWSFAVDSTHAILSADRSATAVYKGLALAGDRLYAANFREARIDIFNSDFSFAGSASDSSVPAGFAPFNIQNIGGTLIVTFARQDNEKKDDVPGAGSGFVTTFNPTSGSFTRFASGGRLNSPWGLARAPGNFGRFSNALLVGNFGDGRISAFDPATGRLLGQLDAPDGRPAAIPGLWSLQFGNGAAGGPRNVLFFTAGIDDEQHGLFGALTATDVRGNRRPGLF